MFRPMSLVSMLSAALAGLFAANFAAARDIPTAYDVVILDGLVVDGTGNPGIYTDVAIAGDTIVRVGPLRAALAEGRATAGEVLLAKGNVVAPGFIDVHTHADGSLLENLEATNFIRDGVTSIVTGNCGGSQLPVGVFLDDVATSGAGLNVATLVGHNSVRRNVIGVMDRAGTPEDLEEMEKLVDEAMREGAVGLSTGLIYRPGTYTKTDEIVALARVAARYGGVYATHMRSEAEGIFAALDEALFIGREAGIPVEISHFKVASYAMYRDDAYATINELLGEDFAPGAHVPQAARATLARVMKARAEGQDVTMDQYPYTASSTGLSTMIPDWVLADGDTQSKELLADPETRAKVAAEMKSSAVRREQVDYSWAQIASCRSDHSLDGLNIRQATERRVGEGATIDDEIETVIQLHVEGGAAMVFHKMAEVDVARIMQNPHVMIASDSSVREFGAGVPHPRGYGTNARVLGRYVRDLHVLTLEDAIRKMSSLPAQRFAFRDRGLVREGMKADIVVFDPAAVGDHATFVEPHHYSTGFKAVYVNGRAVVRDDETTGERPGVPLRGAGYWQRPEMFPAPAPAVDMALHAE